MKQELEAIRAKALEAIGGAEKAEDLEALRVQYLGKRGELTAVLKQMGSLSAEERPVIGQLANEVRAKLEESVETRAKELAAKALEMKLKAEAVDVTIPGKAVKIGKKHPMYQVLDEIKDIFVGMGFEILEDREVETADYNFTKLNCLEGHPAREWTDTFYFTEDSSILLRTQTSPMQIHAMETRSLPIRILAPGRVYRKDEVDATHSPMFHQIEGMAIDKGITMADLKGTLEEFFEILTLKQLGRDDRAIVLLNTLGAFDTLLRMLEELAERRFMSKNCLELYFVAGTPEQAMEYLAGYVPQKGSIRRLEDYNK